VVYIIVVGKNTISKKFDRFLFFITNSRRQNLYSATYRLQNWSFFGISFINELICLFIKKIGLNMIFVYEKVSLYSVVYARFFLDVKTSFRDLYRRIPYSVEYEFCIRPTTLICIRPSTSFILFL
jgi:hypothetical protein